MRGALPLAPGTDGTGLARTGEPPHGARPQDEEKGSDVNIATMLLLDAVRDEYDEAVIISNDSDLVMPIRITRDELRKRVVVLNPGVAFSRAIELAATAYRPISLKSFEAAQFPNPVRGAHGDIHRPTGWDRPADGVPPRTK